MKTKTLTLATITLSTGAVALWFACTPGTEASLSLETTKAKPATISQSVTATGTIEPITEVTVGTQVSGKVSKIYVDFNSEVKKGQVLAEIDKTNLQTEYTTQQLAVQSAKVEYDYQQANFNRINSLHEKSLVSETDFESAKYAYEKAEASHKQAVSNLSKAQTNLDYATIYSPIDGVVLSRAVEEGQTVAASFSTPTMFVIARDLTKMQVVANVDEADIGNVRENQRVSFTVDAYPEDVFDGTVTQVRLNPTTTSNVVTYEVIVNAPNPSLKLKPGLTANITIFTVEKDVERSLPNKALIFNPDTVQLVQQGLTLQTSSLVGGLDATEKLVWLKEGNILCRKRIKIGETDGLLTEVLSGLDVDDVVVIDLGASKQDAATKGPQTAEASSPFMPKRPGSNNARTK